MQNVKCKMQNVKCKMQNVKVKIILLILSLFIIYHCSAATINKTVLDNDLIIITKQNKDSRIIAMEVFIKVGSYYEKDTEAGLTNFIQKLLLKGTKKRPQAQIAYEIDATGSILDVAVHKDFAEIYLVCTTRVFEQCVELLTDILFNPSFDKHQIEKVRREIIEEIEAKKDNYFEFTYDLLLENLYKEHPYYKPDHGYKELVSKFTKEDIIEFYHKYYVPNNMIIAVVSPFEHNEIMKKLKTKFGKYKKRELPEKIIDKKITISEPREVIKRHRVKGAHLMMGFLTENAYSYEYPVLKVVNSILGEGGSSRLFVTLREKEGLCYQISSFYPTRRSYSHFGIYMITAPEMLEKAKSGILWEVAKIKQLPVSEKELNKAKKHLIGNFLMNQESSRMQAFYLGLYEVVGLGYEYYNLYPERIKAVTADDIRHVTNKYFTNWIFTAITP